MKPSFPAFTEAFHFLHQFILELAVSYQSEELDSWETLDDRVKEFFTPERMEQMESLVPGWKKMASYSEGVTLTHVTCVFLGVVMLAEFQALTPEEQQMALWIVLFHDLDKVHIRGKKDTLHGFRSGVCAARILPTLGFPVTEYYQEAFASWCELTLNAFFHRPGEAAPTPDNRKLPEILAGIDRMFGENSPAGLITKTVLLHISLNVDPNYPTPAPLTDAETEQFITPALFLLIKVMMLGDNEGWSLFEPETREQQYRDTIEAFDQILELIERKGNP